MARLQCRGKGQANKCYRHTFQSTIITKVWPFGDKNIPKGFHLFYADCLVLFQTQEIVEPFCCLLGIVVFIMSLKLTVFEKGMPFLISAAFNAGLFSRVLCRFQESSWLAVLVPHQMSLQ